MSAVNKGYKSDSSGNNKEQECCDASKGPGYQTPQSAPKYEEACLALKFTANTAGQPCVFWV